MDWRECHRRLESGLILCLSRNYSIRKGSGVALYIRAELQCRLLETKSTKVEHNFECARVELATKSHANCIII